MKILQVIPFFTPARGGSVTAPYNLSKQLAEKGHEVTIITTDFELDKTYVHSLDGIVRVVPFHCIANIGLMLISPEMKKWLGDNIRDFDIIHMHNFRSYQNIKVNKYARKHGIHYVLQAHGSVLPFFQKQRLKKLYDWVWGYRILKDTSKVIALTRTEADQYKKMGVDEDKIEIVPNGIDLSEYDNLPTRGEFRKKYGIRNDEKIVLYLGRIHKIKGTDLLVEAFSDLSKEFDGVKLVIVGPDDGFLSTLKGQIEDLKIGDKILFTGPLYERDKLKAYVDADVYVLPSVYETFPVTVLEACACGTSVIVTDRCGIADIIGDKVGYVVKYDKVQLSKAILNILTDEKIRQEFGKKTKSIVREKFNWSEITKQIENIYLSCLSFRDKP